MKAKIDIVSGFLGAGKTSLIKRLIEDYSSSDEKVVILQNEHGEVEINSNEIDGRGVDLEGINSGCICCDMMGGFVKSIESVMEWTKPQRIIVEPSGVGRLSEILSVIEKACTDFVEIDGIAVVLDARRFDLYLRNYKGFYDDQIKYATGLFLTKTDKISEEKLLDITRKILELNPAAKIAAEARDVLTAEEISWCMGRSKEIRKAG